MKKLYYTIVSIVCILILYSCSVITKTQKGAVGDFATAAANFSKMPREVFDLQKEAMLKYHMLTAVTESTDFSDMTNKLDASVVEYANSEKFTSDLETTFKLIEKYGAVLGKLVNVDVETDNKQNAQVLGNNIDSLISKSQNKKLTQVPIGFGSLISKLFTGGAIRRLKNKQLVLARDFITKGDILIKAASSVLSELAIDGLIRTDAASIAKTAKTDYAEFLKKVTAEKPTTWDIYNDMNPKFIDIRLTSARALDAAIMLQKASAKLVAAHGEVKDILFKKDAETILGNIASFSSDVLEVKEVIKTIKENKEKLLTK